MMNTKIHLIDRFLYLVVVLILICTYDYSVRSSDINNKYINSRIQVNSLSSPSASQRSDAPSLPWQIKAIEKLLVPQNNIIILLFKNIVKKLGFNRNNRDDFFELTKVAPTASLSNINKLIPSSQLRSLISRFKCRLKGISNYFGLSAIANSITSIINSQKISILFLFKTLGLTFLTVSFIYRVISWYKGIADAEILLDKADFVYHSYGFNLNGISSWLISNLNQSDIEKYEYIQIIKNLETSLDTPCFPRSMNSYANQLNKDIVPILNELQYRIRNSAIASHSSKNMTFSDTISSSDSISESNKNISQSESSKSTESDCELTLPMLDIEEQKLIKGIQRCVLLMQARQTDAILRVTRSQILSSLNTCEDLLNYWKARVMKKTQNFRLPLPRFLMSHVPGLGRRVRSNALRSVQFALHNLNIGSTRRDENGDNDNLLFRDLNIFDENNQIRKKYLKSKSSRHTQNQRSQRNKSTNNNIENFFKDNIFVIKNSTNIKDVINYLNITKLKSRQHSSTLKFNYKINNYDKSNITYTDTISSYTTNLFNNLSASAQNEAYNVQNFTYDPGQVDVDSLLKQLNAREKILFLEEVQEKLYDTAGRAQQHLDRLDLIHHRLIEAVKLYMSRPTTSQPFSDSMELYNNNISVNYEKTKIKSTTLQKAYSHDVAAQLQERHEKSERQEQEESFSSRKLNNHREVKTAWEELENWINSGSLLCSESLNLISLDKNKDMHKQQQYDIDFSRINMQNISSSLSSFYHHTDLYYKHIKGGYKSSNITNNIEAVIPTDSHSLDSDRSSSSSVFSYFYFWPKYFQPKENDISATNVSKDTDADVNSNTTILDPELASTSASKSTMQLSTIELLSNNLLLTRDRWNMNSVLLRDLSRAPSLFDNHLEWSGLKVKKFSSGLFSFKKIRILIKYSLWAVVLASVVEATKRSDDIKKTSVVVYSNFKDFVIRRITTPTISIVNDVIFNNRVSLTDKSALTDAMRSLQVMINDFLKEYRPKMSEAERKKYVNNMDMTPISIEYESELKRPIQNIVSGRIARLVLIQLQFVKKELLMAMQAIDELFNANQVNMQLLAVTPAFLSLVLTQAFIKTLLSTIRSSSKGRFMESTWAVHRDLRTGMRSLEKLLTVSDAYNSPLSIDRMKMTERGKLMSILYRLQNLLVTHSSRFEDVSLRLLQEDLRDLSSSQLSVSQRLALVERILRSYSFFQPTRKLWPTTGF